MSSQETTKRKSQSDGGVRTRCSCRVDTQGASQPAVHPTGPLVIHLSRHVGEDALACRSPGCGRNVNNHQSSPSLPGNENVADAVRLRNGRMSNRDEGEVVRIPVAGRRPPRHRNCPAACVVEYVVLHRCLNAQKTNCCAPVYDVGGIRIFGPGANINLLIWDEGRLGRYFRPHRSPPLPTPPSCLLRDRGQVRVPEVGVLFEKLHPVLEELAASATRTSKGGGGCAAPVSQGQGLREWHRPAGNTLTSSPSPSRR